MCLTTTTFLQILCKVLNGCLFPSDTTLQCLAGSSLPLITLLQFASFCPCSGSISTRSDVRLIGAISQTCQTTERQCFVQRKHLCATLHAPWKAPCTPGWSQGRSGTSESLQCSSSALPPTMGITGMRPSS